MSAPQRANTCAVVITHHPDEKLPERLGRIVPQVDRIFIVDNASQNCVEAMLRASPVLQGVEIIRNTSNLGIAAALNQGLRLAIAHGYQWVLTMDQDSVVDPDLVRYLAQAYLGCPFRNRVGIIGTSFYLGDTRLLMPPAHCGRQGWFEHATAITSGSLLDLSCVPKVGWFREDYFIDYVDYEFCLRLRKRGYHIIIARRPLMMQPMGKPSVRFLPLGKKIISLEHRPLRRYYQTRNRFLLVSEYFSREPRFCLRQILDTAIDVLIVGCCEDHKIAKWRAILLGLWHALIQRSGPLPDTAFSD